MGKTQTYGPQLSSFYGCFMDMFQFFLRFSSNNSKNHVLFWLQIWFCFRTLLGHSKKRFAFRDDDETELDETPPPRRAPRRHFLCEAEKRGGHPVGEHLLESRMKNRCSSGLFLWTVNTYLNHHVSSYFLERMVAVSSSCLTARNFQVERNCSCSLEASFMARKQ